MAQCSININGRPKEITPTQLEALGALVPGDSEDPFERLMEHLSNTTRNMDAADLLLKLAVETHQLLDEIKEDESEEESEEEPSSQSRPSRQDGCHLPPRAAAGPRPIPKRTKY